MRTGGLDCGLLLWKFPGHTRLFLCVFLPPISLSEVIEDY